MKKPTEKKPKRLLRPKRQKRLQILVHRVEGGWGISVGPYGRWHWFMLSGSTGKAIDRETATFPTQTDAMHEARRFVVPHFELTELAVLGLDGKIRGKNTYGGTDPRPKRGRKRNRG
jgi:hypothetical protein